MKGRYGAVAAVALAWPAIADAAPVYFHKPGVAQDIFVADMTECEDLAGAVRSPAQPYVYTPNLYAVAAASFFSGFFGASQRRGLIDNVLRTCMADKGYRRVEASPDTRKMLGTMTKEARVAHLFALAAAPTPAGKVLPR